MRQRKISTIILLIAILSLTILIPTSSFCSSIASEYLCKLGINFYKMGRYDDALLEFKKVLLIDPENVTAKDYINKFFQPKEPAEAPFIEPEKIPAQQISKPPKEPIETPFIKHKEPVAAPVYKEPIYEPRQPARKPIEKPDSERRILISQALDAFSKKEKIQAKAYSPESKLKLAGIKISGNSQLSLGFTSQDTIWKQANYDLNERNWRMLSDAAYNRRFNTFDTRVFDRFRLNLDSDNQTGFGFHSNITIDPWSFTGKSEKITINATNGDVAEIELKYWSNTRYTINESVFTLRKGDSFALPEIKVVGGKTHPLSLASTWINTFNIPELKIEREFQPLRELWFDYKKDGLNLKFFPIAYQDQALNYDDPLKLSNNHIWWEDSPWIRRWKHGIFNSEATVGTPPTPAPDFTKGFWDNSLSFFTRDSDGTRLTALRGISCEFTPQEKTSIASTLAIPKHLWQDYAEVDNIIYANRIKHSISDNLDLGATYTMRTGFNVDDENHTDSHNNVLGFDLGYEIADGVKTSANIASSWSDYDITNSQFRTEARGNAYYFSVTGRYPRKSIMDLKYGYDEMKPVPGEPIFVKSRFYIAHMDEGFDPSLSSYRQTRNDSFWSRHIHFRKPFEYYYSGLYYPALRWEDIEPTRIGNGIDIGREALGLRVETIIRENEASNLFDVRNVHDVNGKYIETVTRDEFTWQVNNKLTAKFLGLYHDLPKTKGNIDPFIFNANTGKFLDDFSGNPIDDGKDPSLKTGSLGLEYAFYDWLSVNGIWERTNDYTLAYGNFPRGVFNSGQPSDTFFENGNKYRRDRPFLYDQQVFPQPPYPFYDIYKTGIKITPIDKLDIYLDYTRNEFAIAGQNSDNMNHIGFETTYMPTDKLGITFNYTYSRWKDPNKLVGGNTETTGHHNLFTEFRYLRTKDDEFALQYGEGGRSAIGNITFDPFGGSLLTIDTQHILRLYYRRKF